MKDYGYAWGCLSDRVACMRAGGVIEMSEFSLFIRNQAKEAERKLKVSYECAVVL